MRKYYDQITRIAGNVVTVSARGVGYDELAVVVGDHRSSLAQVIRLEGDQVSLQVFAGTQGVSTGDRVRFLGHPMQVPFSADLLGRIFDGGGRPRDGRPKVEAQAIDIGGPPVNPTRRNLPAKMIRTGIPMIDVFNSLVESQK
ncbi:MAG: V-type ATP synthase subunit B, partial [Acidobacteria bacterium]|nr:V-type ATP synthase subunit B [Acidobacteriota bacterium]